MNAFFFYILEFNPQTLNSSLEKKLELKGMDGVSK